MDYIGDNITHVARKKHQCHLCGGVIEPGEKYVTTFNVDGGYAFNFNRHLLCNETMENITDPPDDGWTSENFVESVYEELDMLTTRLATRNKITDADTVDIFLEKITPDSFKDKCVLFNTLCEFERIRNKKI